MCVYESKKEWAKKRLRLYRAHCAIETFTCSQCCVYASVRRWIQLSCSLPQSSVLLDIYILYCGSRVFAICVLFSLFLFSLSECLCLWAVVSFSILHTRTQNIKQLTNGTLWQLDNFWYSLIWRTRKHRGKSTRTVVVVVVDVCRCSFCVLQLTSLSNLVSLYLFVSRISHAVYSVLCSLLILRCFFLIRFWQPVQYLCGEKNTHIYNDNILWASIKRNGVRD